MNVIRIDNPADPRLGDYIGVRDPLLVKRRGLFIAESRIVVRRLLDASRFTMKSLLLHDASAAGLADLLSLDARDVDVYVAPMEVIRAVSGFNLHRGCLAVAERPVDRSFDDVVDSSGFVVVLERLSDADNIGSIFRTAEALGANGILLSPGCCDPFYRKAVRTSSGATLMVPFATAEPWPDALDVLRERGFTVAALTPAADAVDIGVFVQSPAARGKVALLLGTEGQGLTDEAFARADVRVRIPMTGAADSLNVGTAAAIAIHRLCEVRS